MLPSVYHCCCSPARPASCPAPLPHSSPASEADGNESWNSCRNGCYRGKELQDELLEAGRLSQVSVIAGQQRGGRGSLLPPGTLDGKRSGKRLSEHRPAEDREQSEHGSRE